MYKNACMWEAVKGGIRNSRITELRNNAMRVAYSFPDYIRTDSDLAHMHGLVPRLTLTLCIHSFIGFTKLLYTIQNYLETNKA